MTLLSADPHDIGAMSAVDVKALDAAMPFDFEHKAQARLTKAKQLTVGIVGFGTFGQFLARRLVQAGHKVHRPHMLPLMPHFKDAHSVGMSKRCAGHTKDRQGFIACDALELAQVLATSRGDYSAEAARIGVDFCGDPDDFCEAHPDVVVLATSITSTVS